MREDLQGMLSGPARGLSPLAGRHSEEHTYRNDRSSWNDLSELLSLPGRARCPTNQSVEVDQTTLVR
jgi:hypothetical protein